jgi:hypothetical protein
VQPGAFQYALVELLDYRLELGHYLEHVDVLFGLRIHGQRGPAVLVQRAAGVAHFHRDFGNVVQVDGLAVAPGQHDVAELLEVVLAREADGVLAPADVLEAARDVGVPSGHPRKRRHVDAQGSRPVGVEGDANFAVASAIEVGVRHSGDALDARLDDFLDEILVARDIAVVAGKGTDGEPRDRAAEAAAPRVHDRLFHVDGIAWHPVEAVHDLDEGALQ